MPHVFTKDLRKAVLQAAISGNLTKREETDSGINSLLEAVKADKKRLITEKKMKNEKNLPNITDDEIPFEIPESWTFVRTGDVIDCAAGSTPLKGHPEYYENGTIPWLKTGELNNSYITVCEEKITETALKNGSFRENQPGDILIAMYGATIGKLGICTFPLTTNQACLGCTPLGGINNRYLFYFFMASKDTLIDKAEGGAQPNISRIKVRNLPMPLPPVEEQARIVARLDELMTKIDEYEKIENKLTALHKKFPTDMKAAILQAAMQGKLTEQSENDGDVDSYILSLKKKQLDLVKSKIIKVGKFSNVISDDLPDIPNSWRYVKMGDISTLVTKQTGFDYSKTIKPALVEKPSDDTVPYIQTRDFEHTSFNFQTKFYAPISLTEQFPNIALHGKHLLLSIVGSIGNIGYYNFEKQAFLGGAITKVNLLDDCLYKYVYYYLQSPLGQFEISKNKRQTAQATVTVEDIRSVAIPFPPIEEQQRIVEKLDQLLPLCDQLEQMAA